MGTPTYIPLASTVLASPAGTVTFSSIPQTYRDLILVVSGTASSSAQIVCRFNASTSGYTEQAMLGFSGGAIAYTVGVSYLSQLFVGTTATLSIMKIMDYSAVDKQKTALYSIASDGVTVGSTFGRWQNQSAINQVSLSPEGSGITFLTGSTFSIYGVN